MPYISEWKPNEVFLTHNGIHIFHTYSNDIDVVRDYCFGTASDTHDEGDETNFDVRDLSTWKEPEDGRDFDVARRSAITAAIDGGHLDEYIAAAENRPKDVPDPEGEAYSGMYLQLEERYAMLIGDVERQILASARALLTVARVPSFEIDLGSQCLTVGEHDPTLGRAPFLYSILISQEMVSIWLERLDGHQPLFDFDTIDVYDKISILAVIENQIDELL